MEGQVPARVEVAEVEAEVEVVHPSREKTAASYRLTKKTRLMCRARTST